MSRIDTLFEQLRSQRRKALMPFVTAGDPDLEFTAAVLTELATAPVPLRSSEASWPTTCSGIPGSSIACCWYPRSANRSSKADWRWSDNECRAVRRPSTAVGRANVCRRALSKWRTPGVR